MTSGLFHFDCVSCDGKARADRSLLRNLRLATQGMRFTSAYTGQAVCAPSRLDRTHALTHALTHSLTRCLVPALRRGSLMTGRHMGHATIRGNAAVACPYCPDGYSDLPLSENDTTVAQVLAAAGYYSSFVGKWGMGYNSTSGVLLRRPVR